jgi:hypothetical protein
VCEGFRVATRWGKLSAGFLGWIAATATAAAVGLFALSAIDFGSVNRASVPQMQDPAEDSTVGPTASTVASANMPSLSPDPTGKPSVTTATVERVFTSPGGGVVARCSTSGAYLVSWSPAQGYHSDDVRRGPGVTARVVFERAIRDAYMLTVRCVNGVPQVSVSRHE